MGWSNIFCQIITPAGPVIGEGLLSGWQTSIELDGFEWSAEVDQTPETDNPGGALAAAVETATPEIITPFKAGSLILHKRFDIATSDLHTLMDNPEMPIISVSITVLHIAHGGQVIHRPGFVILCTDCKIKDVDVKMEPGEQGVQIREDVTIDFQSITITYMRSIGKEVVPTIPFVYIKAAPASDLF